MLVVVSLVVGVLVGLLVVVVVVLAGRRTLHLPQPWKPSRRQGMVNSAGVKELLVVVCGSVSVQMCVRWLMCVVCMCVCVLVCMCI